MNEDYGGNFLTIVDEDGNEIELEHLDTLEYNGEVYMSFFPAEDEDAQSAPDDEDYGMIILKVVEENGEEHLVTLESDEELEAVYEQFMESLCEEDETDEKKEG